MLEEKQPGDAFEEYDPTQMFIKVNLWRPGLVTLAESELKPKQIRVAKDMPLAELLALLGQRFHIEVEHFEVMKRSPVMSISTVEKLTEKRNQACTLKMLKVNEGVNLFVEDSSPSYPGIE